MEEYEEISESWLTKCRRELAPSSTRRRLTSVRQFALWAGWGAVAEEYSAPNPGTPQPHPLPEGMEGVRRMLLAATSHQHKALVALCGMCGLRISEALSVVYKDFSFQSPGQVRLTVRGKGDVTRTVPVSAEALENMTFALGLAMINGGPVVPIEDRLARRVVTRLGSQARLSRDVASHDLRATFATAVYNKTKDQRLVQTLLGHSSGRTTEGYIGVAMEAMSDGVEGL